MAGWPRFLWFALAALQGLTGPNIGAMVRSRWARMVATPAQLNTAFALESTLDEVAFVIGPPLATMLAVAVAPWSAVATGILFSLAGTLGLAVQRRTEPPAAPRGRGATGRVWSAVMAVVVGLMFLMGGIFGALEVATVAFALERGVPGATGWFLGAFALASMATGLFLGMRELSWRLSHQIIAGAAVLAACTTALPFITTPWLFGLGMFATGLGCSAVLIGGMQLVERSQPANRLTESLAVAVSGIMVGSAAAVAVAGAAIDASGASAGLAVAAVAAIVGLLLAVGAGPLLRGPDPLDRSRVAAPGLTPAGAEPQVADRPRRCRTGGR
jgi:predicted MFS family arabinose efflux permease